MNIEDSARKIFEANILAQGELTKYSDHPVDAQTDLKRYNEGRGNCDYVRPYTALRWQAFLFGYEMAHEEAAATISEKDKEIAELHANNGATIDCLQDSYTEISEQLRASNDTLVAAQVQVEYMRESVIKVHEHFGGDIKDLQFIDNLTALEADRKEVAKKASIKTLIDAADSNEFDSDTNYKLRRMAAEIWAEG